MFLHLKLTLIAFCLALVSPSEPQIPKKLQEWTTTTCYQHIFFRIQSERKVGNRHEWKIQFKNGYDQFITFNYGTTEDAENHLTTNRKSLQPNEISKPILVYTQDENFYLLVDKLSFSLYDEDIIPCDNNN